MIYNLNSHHQYHINIRLKIQEPLKYIKSVIIICVSCKKMSLYKNRMPMDHIAHPRKKPKSIQSSTFVKQEAHGPHRSPEKTVQINKHI